jgi:hypothetical protein
MRKLPFFFFCAALGALSPCRGETFTIGVALLRILVWAQTRDHPQYYLSSKTPNGIAKVF